MNRTLYSCLFYLALPLVALRLWLRARKAPAYAKRVGERFSWGLPVMQPGGIWVHAVSVGESIAAAPMIRGLLEGLAAPAGAECTRERVEAEALDG